MPTPFLDTNIFLRHLTGEPLDQAEKSTTLFEKIERGEIAATTSLIVIFEVVFTLERFYKQKKENIRDMILPLLELPNIHIQGKRQLQRVFAFYVGHNISFADAYHVVFMQQNKLKEIISYDRDFDKIPTITRKEP
jgi:predicted nucleic acid-binding protein